MRLQRTACREGEERGGATPRAGAHTLRARTDPGDGGKPPRPAKSLPQRKTKQITRRMDLWERGQHAGLVGDAEAEEAAREGRSAFSSEEEDDVVARSFHETVLLGKLRQAVRRATNREGGGCLLSDEQCTKTGRPVSEVLREKHPDMRVPPVENPA